MTMEELMKDEVFLKLLDAANTAEEAAELFARKGVQISVQELAYAFANESEELDENALDAVAGGGLISVLNDWVRKHLNQSRTSSSGGGFSCGGGRHG